MKIILIQTCSICPEQYDAMYNDVKIGYLRLRNGHFTVDHVNPQGWCHQVLSSYPDGDGCFEDIERDFFLEQAVRAIVREEFSRVPDELEFEVR